jgi:voltage-gated potassium channel
LPTDEANLFVTITARSLNPRVRIVAKGIDIKSHDKMKKAGADSVVSPTFIGGMRMVSDMVRPAVVTFLDMMLRDKEQVLRVEEVAVGEGSALAGKTIEEAKLEEKTGALLVALKKAETKGYEFNPPKGRKIQENDILIFIGSPEKLSALRI